jgi:hypothetical protein
LLEVDGADALGVARLGFGGGFGDERDHEELEGFRCEVLGKLVVYRIASTYKQRRA